jgi:predicted metalloprotease with PDZ domain
LLLFATSRANAADTVNVVIKLQKTNPNQIAVSITYPKSDADRVKLIFPSYLPGAFNEVATGNLASELLASNVDGASLALKKLSYNEYEIETKRSALKVSYLINDSWFTDYAKHGLMPQMGTVFKPEEFFLLNLGCVLPFLEGKEKLPVKVSVSKPAVLNGFSPLRKSVDAQNAETYVASNYLALIDNPIVFTNGYEITFRSGGTVFHCIANAYGKLSDQLLMKTLKPVCDGITKFCKGYPVKDYYFFILLLDSNDTKTRLSEEDFGAMQHSASTVMVLKNYQDNYKLQREIQATASHELFHLFQPLNIKTDLNSKLNMRAKVQTAHLWFYEGVTEYFSLLMQMREDLITQTEFITEMRNKMSLMQFYEPFSLTEQSEKSLMSGNETVYRNFYYKGAVVAMMLDLRLLELSQGQLNLQELLLRFKRSMNENYVVKDEELITELVRISSFTELNDFFNDFVGGTKAVDFNKFLPLIGWIYEPIREDTSQMYVNAAYRYDKGSKNIYVTNINIDQIGIQEGDVLLKINNKKVYKDNIDELMDKISNTNYNRSVTFLVKRKGQELKLTGKPLVVNKTQRNVVKVEKRPAPDKQFYRNVYKSGQLSTGKPYRLLN